MEQENPWEDFEWPLTVDTKMLHELVMDLRKHIYLASEGHFATTNKATQAAHVLGSTTRRFAREWSTRLSDYPTSDMTAPDTTPPSPTTAEGFYQTPYVDPGEWTCWFERSFNHSIQGVVKTGDDYEFKFLRTAVTKYSIWEQNSGALLYQKTPKITWYEEEDDFRPGTPFIITNCAEAANDGFYRVKSVRNDGSNVYVMVDDNNYTQQDLVETSSVAGNADCDFGGDWYTLRSGNGHSSTFMESGGQMNNYFAELDDNVYTPSVTDAWWTKKDRIHRYEGSVAGTPTYGPNDGRPPTGGYMSKDFNGDWVRCPNPSLYHTYDENSHRWAVKSGTEGSIAAQDLELFTALIPASKYLCFQADPKEQKSPFFFEDTHRIHWKYGGKVSIEAMQITNPAKLGAVQAVRRTGYSTGEGSTFHGASTDHQYNSTYLDPVGDEEGYRGVDGDTPDTEDTQSFHAQWKDVGYDPALQNTIEHICGMHKWVFTATSVYIDNWLWLHEHVTIDSNHQDYLEIVHDLTSGDLDGATYGDIKTTYGTESAWMPAVNPDQPAFPLATDEEWGENGSAFELILAMLGDDYYDWYYDTTYPYRSKTQMDWSWWWGMDNSEQSFDGTYNGIYCDTPTKVKNACWPTPIGCWRRVWKRTLGRPKPSSKTSNSDMVIGDDENEPLSPQVYEFDHPGLESVNRMVGRVVTTYDDTGSADPNIPTDSDFYTTSLAGTPSSNTFVASGNQISAMPVGSVVFGVISSVRKPYGVVKSTYDSGENETTFILNGDFETDAPTTLYIDLAISANHDAGFIVNDSNIHVKNIWKMLNACREVLLQLRYKKHLINVQFGNNWIEPVGEIPEDKDPEVLIETVNDALIQGYNNISSIRTDFTFGAGLSWLGALLTIYFDNDPYWVYYEGADCYVGALKLTVHADEPFLDFLDNTSQHAYHVLVKAYQPSGAYESDGKTLVDGVSHFGLTGAVNITCQSTAWYYGWATLQRDAASEVYWNNDDPDNPFYEFYYSVGTLHHFLPPITDYHEFASPPYLTGSCGGYANVQSPEVLSEFNWLSFPDIIWTRLKERADYKLVDSFSPDKNPPVTVNKYVVEPTFIDMNYTEGLEMAIRNGVAHATDLDVYEAEWHLYAVVTLLEDLEGNGVEYIFDLEETVGTDVWDAVYSRVQASRVYDELLGSTGGWSDAHDAMADRAKYLEMTYNSKDDVSSNVPSAEDNYNEPLAPLLLKVTDAPMFPIRPDVACVSSEDNSQELFQVISCRVPLPATKEFEYKLERWTGTAWEIWQDYGESHSDPPDWSPTDNQFWVRVATYPSPQKFRLRIVDTAGWQGQYSFDIEY